MPGGGALAYDDLGRLPLPRAPAGRRTRRATATGRRWSGCSTTTSAAHTHLVETLEQYLRGRRRGATTARTLYIHPNTLRQRLDRIEKLSGLDLAAEDLLSLELAVKLVRLRRASAGAAAEQPDPHRREAEHVEEEDEQAPPQLDLEA